MARKLSLYRQKRDFTKTAEPSGTAKVAAAEYPRFVIQKHAATRLHYDLRLEVDGVFKSWAVTKGLSLDPKDKRLAVETEDHPLDYGDFEGTIPKGEYGGGTVMLWDRGFWAADGDAAKALRKGELKFTLAGEKLQGSWVLVRLRHDRERGKRTNWLLIKRHDGYEREGDSDSILAQDRSVASGRSMEEIAAGKGRSPKPSCSARSKLQGQRRLALQSQRRQGGGPLPDPKPQRAHGRACAKQLAQCRHSFRRSFASRWAGRLRGRTGFMRSSSTAIACSSGCRRRGGDAHAQGPRLDRQIRGYRRGRPGLPDCIIDGEVVALDHNGTPDFSALQAAFSEGRSRDLTYFVFDLLFEGDEDLRRLPLTARKERLRSC